MKKLLTSLLVVTMLLVSLGGAVLAEPRQPSAETEDQIHEAGTVPAQTDVWTAMLPPIHALVATMVENDMTYDSDSSLFQWTSLYYMLSLYGQMDDRAELSDAYMTLPSEAILDYAAPLFPQLTELPQLPQDLADRITYHAASDTYQLARGDEGLSQLKLTASYPTGNTGRLISGQMIYLETGEVLYWCGMAENWVEYRDPAVIKLFGTRRKYGVQALADAIASALAQYRHDFEYYGDKCDEYVFRGEK